MSYSTPADVRLILDATGDPGDEETPNPTADASFTDAIVQADGQVDLYVGSRYAVPLSGSPAAEPVRTWSRVIAAWNIYSEWHKGQPIDVNDPLRLRYGVVIAQLAAVQAGTLDLPGVAESTASGTPAAAVNQYAGNLWPSSILQPAHSYPWPVWGSELGLIP